MFGGQKGKGGVRCTDSHMLAWPNIPWINVCGVFIGNFFLFGLLFIFVGIIGEYILSIQTYVKKRPLVTEKDRINF